MFNDWGLGHGIDDEVIDVDCDQEEVMGRETCGACWEKIQQFSGNFLAIAVSPRGQCLSSLLVCVCPGGVQACGSS